MTVLPFGMVRRLSGVLIVVSRMTRNTGFAILYGVLFVGFAYICGLIIGLLQCNWAYHGAKIRRLSDISKTLDLFL